MKRGRKSLAKKSDSKIRELLLNAKVDIYGNYISWRDIYTNPDIMWQTGFYRRKEYEATGKLIPLSEGSMSYHISPKKYNLTEHEVYLYHRDVTHRIEKSMEFDDFKSLVNGKVFDKEEMRLSEYILKTSKQNACRILNYIADRISYPDMCFDYYTDTDLMSFYEVMCIIVDNDEDYLNDIFREVR